MYKHGVLRSVCLGKFSPEIYLWLTRRCHLHTNCKASTYSCQKCTYLDREPGQNNPLTSENCGEMETLRGAAAWRRHPIANKNDHAPGYCILNLSEAEHSGSDTDGIDLAIAEKIRGNRYTTLYATHGVLRISPTKKTVDSCTTAELNKIQNRKGARNIAEYRLQAYFRIPSEYPSTNCQHSNSQKDCWNLQENKNFPSMLTLNTAPDPIPPADWADPQHSHEKSIRDLRGTVTFSVFHAVTAYVMGTTYPEKLSVGLHRPHNPSLGSSKALLEAF